jgi:hypothetical protein
MQQFRFAIAIMQIRKIANCQIAKKHNFENIFQNNRKSDTQSVNDIISCHYYQLKEKV